MSMMLVTEAARAGAHHANRHRGATAFTLALVLGVPSALILGNVHAQKAGAAGHVILEGGEGVVKSTFTMNPVECHGGYEVTVTDSTAGWSATYNDKDVPGAWAKETYTGDIVVPVCNKSTTTPGERLTDHVNNLINITIPSDGLSTFVYEKNPAAAKITPQDGPVLAIYANDFNLWNSLPFDFKINTTNDIHSMLGGLARMLAFNTASKECANNAWSVLKPAYVEKIKEQEVNNANENLWPGEKPFTKADVTVTVPDDITITSQYETKVSDISKQLTANSVKLDIQTSKGADGSACRLDPKLTTKNGG